MKSSSGYVVSKCRALTLLIVFIGSLIAVGLLVYFLADRPAMAGEPSTEAASSSSSSMAGKKPAKAINKNVRLPRAVLPRRYNVRLFPNLEKGNFSILGHVSIDLECKKETDRIVLHAKELDVDPKSVKVC